MSSYWIKSVLRESFVFFAYFYRRLFRSCGFIKGCRLDTASFFGKILPLAVWRFSRKPLWSELSIPICEFTFATGTYLTGVLKYLRRFTGRIATKWLALLLATPEKTRVLDAKECVKEGAYYKMGSWLYANKQWKAGTASPWSKCTLEGTDKCLSSVWHFRRTLVGDCPSADNSLYLSRRTRYDARNTECCMPECFSISSS